VIDGETDSSRHVHGARFLEQQRRKHDVRAIITGVALIGIINWLVIISFMYRCGQKRS